MDRTPSSHEGNRSHTAQSPTPQRSRRRGRRSTSPQCTEDPVTETPARVGVDPFLFTPESTASRSLSVVPLSMPSRLATRARSAYPGPGSQELVTLTINRDVEQIDETRNTLLHDPYGIFSQSQYMDQSQYEGVVHNNNGHNDMSDNTDQEVLITTLSATDHVVSRQPSYDLFSQSDGTQTVGSDPFQRSQFSQASQSSQHLALTAAQPVPFRVYTVPQDVSALEVPQWNQIKIDDITILKVTSEYLQYCQPLVTIPELSRADILTQKQRIIEDILTCRPFSMTLLKQLLPTVFTSQVHYEEEQFLPCVVLPSHASLALEYVSGAFDVGQIQLQGQFQSSIVRDQCRRQFACRSAVMMTNMSVDSAQHPVYMAWGVQEYFRQTLTQELLAVENGGSNTGQQYNADSHTLVCDLEGQKSVYCNVESLASRSNRLVCIHCGNSTSYLPEHSTCMHCLYVPANTFQPRRGGIDLSQFYSEEQLQRQSYLHNTSSGTASVMSVDMTLYEAVERQISRGDCVLLLQVIDLPANQDVALCVVQSIHPDNEAVLYQSTAVPVLVPVETPSRTIRGSFFNLYGPFELSQSNLLSRAHIPVKTHSLTDDQVNQSNQQQGDVVGMKSRDGVLFFDCRVKQALNIVEGDSLDAWPVLRAGTAVSVALDGHEQSQLLGNVWQPAAFLQEQQSVVVRAQDVALRQAAQPLRFPCVGKRVKPVLNAAAQIRLPVPAIDTAIFLQECRSLPAVMGEPVLPQSPNQPYIPLDRTHFYLCESRPVLSGEVCAASAFDQTLFSTYHSRPSQYVAEITRQHSALVHSAVQLTVKADHQDGQMQAIGTTSTKEHTYVQFLGQIQIDKQQSKCSLFYFQISNLEYTAHVPLNFTVPAHALLLPPSTTTSTTNPTLEEEFRWKNHLTNDHLLQCLQDLPLPAVTLPTGPLLHTARKTSREQWLLVNLADPPENGYFYAKYYSHFFHAYSGAKSSQRLLLSDWDAIHRDSHSAIPCPSEYYTYNVDMNCVEHTTDFHVSALLPLLLPRVTTEHTQSLYIEVYTNDNTSIPELIPLLSRKEQLPISSSRISSFLSSLQ